MTAFETRRVCLLAAAGGGTVAGATIMLVGMTAVLVPQDVEYLGVSADELHALNPRLISLIAHDRAGFGGALASAGVAAFLCVGCGRPSKSLGRAMALAGLTGFGPAIGVHFVIAYTDPVHLAPAVAGAGLYALGLIPTSSMMARAPIGERTHR